MNTFKLLSSVSVINAGADGQLGILWQRITFSFLKVNGSVPSAFKISLEHWEFLKIS